MADVGDRAQIILVIGLVLAVMFVALSLVLNTAIFTENLATRSNDGVSDGAIEFHHDAIASTQDAIEYANANDATLEASVENSVRDYNRLSLNHSARNGKVTNVTVNRTYEGRHIWQATDSTFESSNPDEDWTLANDVSGTREFRMNVEPTSACTDLSNCFFVEFDDGSDPMRMYLNLTDDNHAKVSVENSTVSQSCEGDSSQVSINITAGTISGDSCSAFSLLQTVEKPYDIHYRNAANATGTYDLTVNSTSLPANYGIVDSEPQSEVVLYSVWIDITYNHPDLRYSNTVEVTPEESA